MHIMYTPEFGFTWLPTLISQPGLIAVDKELGQPGIYYVLAFGLPISPHSYLFDMVERDKMVREEIKSRKLGTGVKKDRFPDKFYETVNCKQAIIEATRLICTPSMVTLYTLERQIRDYEAVMDGQAVSKIKDPAERDKELKASRSAYDLVSKLRSEQRTEEEHINKMVSQSGMLTMDMVWDS